MTHEESADIGLIGLAVMGQNLVLNMNDHGYKVVVYNRTTSKVDDFLSGGAKGTKVVGSHSLQEFFKTLKRPRKVMMMVKAGEPVDALIKECMPFLEKGDVVIDGGNAHFPDTERRYQELTKKGIYFIGAGVSGGEEGARFGPSIMPGGNPDAWSHVKSIFQSICAKVGDDQEACCDWVGNGGAGHYVKMVHNGIEYGDMQLICEAYQLLRDVAGCSEEELQETFAAWNQGDLDSYLIEITEKILGYREESGELLLNKILDKAGQKGTGKWTAIDALDKGMPVTLIGESVFARCLSALKEERVEASKIYPKKTRQFDGDKKAFIENVRQALFASKIISYAQGFMLMRQTSEEMGWNLNFGAIALMWRGGCIIRSRFLGDIYAAYQKDPQLKNLLFADFFKSKIQACEDGWRETVAIAAKMGVPAPSFGTALSFFDGYTTETLPANLLQAQRDFFGAHTYERVDGQGFHHTNWLQ